MNQEKIGVFIAKCRKEKKMTQQELASILGVTDKAISKWENGRCLMDISLLKPLSECLGVSIIELINGEKIKEEEKDLKTEEIIENTLNYTNDKIKNIVRSVVRVLVGVIIGLLIMFGWFLYKTYCAYTLYYVYESDYFSDGESYDKALNCLNDSNVIEIYGSEIDESEYLVLDKFKIRDDFLGYERMDNLELGGVSFVNSSDKMMVSFGVKDTYVSNFKTYSYSSSRGDSEKVREEFLLDNKIDNDLDLFDYIKDNYYMENNWYYSINRLRDNYMINEFALDSVFRESDNCVRIKGMYDGYIYSYSYKNEDTCEISNTRVVEIFGDNFVYVITFTGNKFMNDEYMIDLLSTLVIS